MAGIDRSSPSQRSIQQSSRVSPNEAPRHIRPEQNPPADATQQARTPPGRGYSTQDAWEDAPVRPNLNLGTMGPAAPADVQLVQQTVPAEESAGTDTDIDWDFIGEQEGAASQEGYVPNPEESQSGVTVGTGVDLGARNANDLEALGLSDALREKLEPYLGLKKQDAVDALAANPLNLTAEEVEELDEAVKEQAVDSLVSTYNEEVNARNAEDGGSRSTFEELPAEMQTVIASVHFQYGSLESETPNFFDQVVDQRWSDALGNLRDFGDDYSSRRGREADLLESAMALTS